MKTRIIIQLSLLFLAVFLILSLVPRTGEAQQTTGARIIWNPDIKIEPAKDMNALQLVNNKVDQAAFTNRADSILRKLLGKTGVAITRERIGTADNMLAWIDKDDPSSMIMQDTRNGNLFFSNRMNRYTSLDNVNLPTREEAQDKAVGFLKGMDMLPADFTANSKLLHVGGLASQAFRDGEPGPIVEKLMTLHFGRSINGIPVQGPGSKIIIDIGDGGEIVNFAKKWNAFKTVVQVVQPNDLTKKFEPTTKKSIGGMAEGDVKPRMKGRIKIAPMERVELTKSEYLNQDEVRKMIEATILKEWTTADKIEVNDVQLVYYDRSGDWIQPAYGVIITIHWGEESLEYLFHIPALRNPPEAIYEQVELKNPLEKVEAMKTGQFEFD